MLYQLRLAWKSLIRHPILSLLMVSGIGLGIGVAMVFVTAHVAMSADPLPGKSDHVVRVQLDAWDPEEPWDDGDPTAPPKLLTYRDAMALMESDVPLYHSAIFRAEMALIPDNPDQRPTREEARLCFNDFFPMFDVPFRYGSAWDDAADEAAEPVVVIGSGLNQRLFGGENSVGRTVRLENRDFRIVGILDNWKPLIRFYETSGGGPFDPPEEIYLPFHVARELELYSAGNSQAWKALDIETYEDYLNEEVFWIQFWAEVDGPRGMSDYKSFLNAYAVEQQQAGRIPRPENTRARPLMEWLQYEEVVPEEATALMLISLLFLLICSVNLIGILLGKFLAGAPELSVRRALGASRAWVFVQHLIECELIGIAGGLLGLGISVIGMNLTGRLFDDPDMVTLDWNMFFLGVVLALFSALVAGIYPSWRVCRIPPGAHLKSQ